MFIGGAGIGIGHDNIRSQAFTIYGDHARGAPVLQRDLGDVLVQPNLSALILDHANHGIGHRLHTAHGIMDAEFLFEVADKYIHAGDAGRIATDEQRVKRQRHAQTFVLHTARGVAIDRPIRTQTHETGEFLHKIHELVHRASTEALEAELIALFTIGQELAIPGKIVRRQARDLCLHGGFVLLHAQDRAVAPADLVIRIDGPQIDVGLKITATFSPELLKDLRDSHDGRAKIEPMPVLSNRRATPPGAVQPIKDRDAVSFCAKTHRGGQAAQTGANDNRAGGIRGGHQGRSLP